MGLTQGLTEFIPVSSSGHLVLLHQALGITDNGLAFDVALHLGTLLALLIFFNKELINLTVALFRKNEQTRLAWLLILATVPAVAAGVLLESAAESSFRSARLVGLTMAGFAFVMIAAERYTRRQRRRDELKNVSWRQALIMGFVQALAIIPGISRSGSTITAGLFVGLDRVAATRFSFLLAIPITFGAILKVFTEQGTLDQVAREQTIFIIGILSAFVSGLFAIKFLLKYLAKHTLDVFAYYRIALGIFVLLVTFIA